MKRLCGLPRDNQETNYEVKVDRNLVLQLVNNHVANISAGEQHAVHHRRLHVHVTADDDEDEEVVDGQRLS